MHYPDFACDYLYISNRLKSLGQGEFKLEEK